MSVLRQRPRRLAVIGKKLSLLRPAGCQSRAFASDTPKPDQISDDGDLESSSLMTPDADADVISTYMEGIKEGRRSSHDLEHQRYQYHPPRYWRGPLHPLQSPPSSDPTSREFVPGPFNVPRLSQTWETTFAPDMMAMLYEHRIPGQPKPPTPDRLRKWDDSSPYMENRGVRGPRGRPTLYPLERDITWSNIPRLEAVNLNSHIPKMSWSRDHLWTAWSAFQAVTGKIPDIIKGKNTVSWGSKRGGLAGVKVTIEGDAAYEFVDRLVHLVLPKIKDWPGVKESTGDHSGNLAFGLSAADFSFFPELEVNQHMYPARLIPGCHIILHTTAKSDRHAKILLKTLGFPFYAGFTHT